MKRIPWVPAAVGVCASIALAVPALALAAHQASPGFKAEYRLRPAKSAWRYSSLVTAGAFGGGTRQDDLLALWPGGKLVMYGDTTAKALGRERLLVPARIS